MVRLIGPINALAVYLEGDDGELFQDQVLDLSRLKLASSGGKVYLIVKDAPTCPNC